MRHYAIFTVCLIIWWSAVAAIYAEMSWPMARIARPDLNMAQALAAIWLGWLLWVPLSLIFIMAVGRNPIEAGRVPSALATAGVCVALAIVTKAAFVININDGIPLWYASTPSFAVVLQDSARNNFILAVLVVGTAHGVHFAQGHAESRVQIALLEASLTRARLDMLSSQLNPHFMFNALNSIAETVHHDARTADAMIVSLASLLRQSLDRSTEHLIPLSDELELLDHYLALQRLRFGDSLCTEIKVARECMTALVPKLFLQPLAENAIVHGISRQLGGGHLHLEIASAKNLLRFQLTSDGPLRKQDPQTTGTGLDNVRQRLDNLFGAKGNLTIASVEGHRTRVVVTHPILWKTPT